MTIIAIRRTAIRSSAVFIALSFPFGAHAVSPGQLDDFENGTRMQWEGNRLGSVTTVPTGGPNGAGDGYLQTSIRQFPFHLGTKNQSQWKGNYLAAGIDAIEMDLNDIDGDGVCGDVDACPDSDVRETVSIGYCDTGVPNGLLEDGCTLADLIAETVEDCAGGAKNDGQFVSCVARSLREFRSAGLISGKEYGALVSCAARADKQ